MTGGHIQLWDKDVKKCRHLHTAQMEFLVMLLEDVIHTRIGTSTSRPDARPSGFGGVLRYRTILAKEAIGVSPYIGPWRNFITQRIAVPTTRV